MKIGTQVPKGCLGGSQSWLKKTTKKTGAKKISAFYREVQQKSESDLHGWQGQLLAAGPFLILK